MPLEAGALGLLIGVLVVLPWAVGSARGEFLLLTDWVSGPTATVSHGLFGLSDEALDAMPWRMGVQVLRDLLGPSVAAWLLVLLPFPVAAAGAAHLVHGGRLASYAAAIVMVCNPLFIDRVAVGHVPFLVGVALLPWLLASARHARTQGKWFSARTTGWLALAVSVSPHMAWIGGVALLLVAVVPRPTWRDLARLGLVVVAAAGVYAYAIAVIAAGVPTIAVGRNDLSAFATRADSAGGLLVSVLTLRGFWRDGGDRVAADLGVLAAPVALAFATIVIVGVVALFRRPTTRGPLSLSFIIVGALLAMGTAGPTGVLYGWAFQYLPLFEAMREPQKWTALVLVGCVLAVAGTVQALVERQGRPVLAKTGAVAVLLLPLALLPSLAWGLGGTVESSRYPDGWAAADQALADEVTLFLPWHGYQPFAFTDARSVATPAAAYFTPAMLSSAAVEVGPLRTNSTSRRQQTVDGLVATAGGADFAGTLAELGVRQVVLAKDAAPNEDYSWVGEQPGLELLSASDTMDAYRVVPRTPGQDRVVRDGATAFDIRAGDPGEVVLPVECSDGWQLDGEPGTCTSVGTVAFDVGPEPARVEYQPWSLIRPGVIVSLGMLILLVAVGLVEHANELRRRPR